MDNINIIDVLKISLCKGGKALLGEGFKMHDQSIMELNAQAEKHAETTERILNEVHKVIVGQHGVLEKILIALVADGHVLLEGLPGLAKTMMIKTLSDVINTRFVRIQFTPDLLPADITGTKIYNQNTATFSTEKGPIFANLILADEINRAPPKVQSALLEAMQERQVTISGETFPLENPFMVMATQNPLESEGVYKLPEAQVDRFMFKLFIDYPTKDEEKIIIDRMTTGDIPRADKLISPEKILEMQRFNTKIYADDKIKDYVTDIVQATRTPEKYGVDVKGLIEYGTSPRASLWMILGGKAHALMHGRGYVKPEDIKAIAHDVMRHRIILTYEAEAESIKPDDIIDRIIQKVKIP